MDGRKRGDGGKDLHAQSPGERDGSYACETSLYSLAILLTSPSSVIRKATVQSEDFGNTAESKPRHGLQCSPFEARRSCPLSSSGHVQACYSKSEQTHISRHTSASDLIAQYNISPHPVPGSGLVSGHSDRLSVSHLCLVQLRLYSAGWLPLLCPPAPPTPPRHTHRWACPARCQLSSSAGGVG